MKLAGRTLQGHIWAYDNLTVRQTYRRVQGYARIIHFEDRCPATTCGRLLAVALQVPHL